MPAWPTVEDYKVYARVGAGDTVDDSMIAETLAAASAYVEHQCWIVGEAELDADRRLAVLLLTNRLMTRRNSPEGIVGVGVDGLVAHIGAQDMDVINLMRRPTGIA